MSWWLLSLMCTVNTLFFWTNPRLLRNWINWWRYVILWFYYSVYCFTEFKWWWPTLEVRFGIISEDPLTWPNVCSTLLRKRKKVSELFIRHSWMLLSGPWHDRRSIRHDLSCTLYIRSSSSLSENQEKGVQCSTGTGYIEKI